MTCTLCCGDGVGQEQVVKPVLLISKAPRPDEHILSLGVWTASAAMSLVELHPVEGPPKALEVLLNLSLAESVVMDGVQALADPAGGGNGGTDGLMAGQHSDGD